MPIVCRYQTQLEYDLMCRTRFTLDDLGRGLTWRALFSFVMHLDSQSCTWKAMHKDKMTSSLWESPRIVPQLLATLVDELRRMEYLYASSKSKHKLKEPMPIERPGVKTDKKKLGQEPISVKDFDKWWNGEGEEKHG